VHLIAKKETLEELDIAKEGLVHKETERYPQIGGPQGGRTKKIGCGLRSCIDTRSLCRKGKPFSARHAEEEGEKQFCDLVAQRMVGGKSQNFTRLTWHDLQARGQAEAGAGHKMEKNEDSRYGVRLNAAKIKGWWPFNIREYRN